MTSDSKFQKYHLSKLCSYCSGMTAYAPLEEMERHGISIYFCHPCLAEYVYFQSGTLASQSLYTTINHRMYRYSISYGGTTQLRFIGQPGIPGQRPNRDTQLIKTFRDTPDLTPQNINEKLRTWLIFL